LTDDGIDVKARHEGFRYFGTFSRALFSMFEMTLANFTGIGRFLLDDVSEYFGMASIFYKLTMGFTMIAVINGCFIKETFKLAEQDDLLMIIQKDKDRKVHMEKMMRLLDMADMKGDGTLTRQEFLNVCQDPEVDKWLGAQGLRVTDAGAIYDLIDPGNGLIHKEELVMGARKLQGNARSLDVAKNHFIVAQAHKKIEQMIEMMHYKFDEVLKGLDKEEQELATLEKDTEKITQQLSRAGSSLNLAQLDHLAAFDAFCCEFLLVALGAIDVMLLGDEALGADGVLAGAAHETLLMPLPGLVLHLLHAGLENISAAIAASGKLGIIAGAAVDTVSL